MTEHNFFTYSGKIIFQILGEILYFPLWWYSVGFVRFLTALGKFWLNQEQVSGFGVWAKNIFVPMYGQRDIASRLISFVMRSIQIVVRGAGLLFLLVLLIFLVFIWLALPLFLLYATGWQLGVRF